MKKLLLLLFAFTIVSSYGQNVGIGTSTPDVNALLDVKSGNKGILVPRMDSIARKLIPDTKGLLVYDSTTNSFWFNTGTGWKNLSAGSNWALNGNSGTSAVTDFIGTVDDKPLFMRINNKQSGLLSRASKNTFWGYQAGFSDSVGIENTSSGYQSLLYDTSGNNNTASGAFSLYSNLSGNANTSMGHKSLYFNTTGTGNSANGTQALYSNVSGNNNSAQGFQSLFSNATGSFNTANGPQALFSNISGGFNTATGSLSLYSNITGIFNTSSGFQSLFSDTTGNFNTAIGAQSLFSAKAASNNTATGVQSLYSDSSGNSNTATGYQSLYFNKAGNNNAAMGSFALQSNTNGDQNTAMGSRALMNTNGFNNIGVGYSAGTNLSSGINNIDIGNQGTAGDTNTIRIGSTATKTYLAGVFGSLTAASGISVFVDANGQLGTVSSSARFKQDIDNIGKSSEDIYKLRPVTFRYKEQVLHGDRSYQYGLIAEEVEQVNPLLVSHSPDGSIYTVKYQLLTPLMLHEIQKEHAENKRQADLLEQQEVRIKNLEQENNKINTLQQEITTLRKLINKKK